MVVAQSALHPGRFLTPPNLWSGEVAICDMPIRIELEQVVEHKQMTFLGIRGMYGIGIGWSGRCRVLNGLSGTVW